MNGAADDRHDWGDDHDANRNAENGGAQTTTETEMATVCRDAAADVYRPHMVWMSLLNWLNRIHTLMTTDCNDAGAVISMAFVAVVVDVAVVVVGWFATPRGPYHKAVVLCANRTIGVHVYLHKRPAPSRCDDANPGGGSRRLRCHRRTLPASRRSCAAGFAVRPALRAARRRICGGFPDRRQIGSDRA